MRLLTDLTTETTIASTFESRPLIATPCRASSLSTCTPNFFFAGLALPDRNDHHLIIHRHRHQQQQQQQQHQQQQKGNKNHQRRRREEANRR